MHFQNIGDLHLTENHWKAKLIISKPAFYICAIILGGGFWKNSGDIIYTLLEPNIAPENERLEDDRFLFRFRPIVRELR